MPANPTFLELARDPARRNTLLAASLGWMLDSMDVMLFALLIPAIERDLRITAATAGAIMSFTLIAAAFGGVFFGFLADRLGRTRALTYSILFYCLATGLCAFTHSAGQLIVCRVLLGLGMGGEWAAGAALVAETWPAAHRAKALGLVQSAWAIGYALAAALTALILPHFSPHLGWRAVFLTGTAPALVTFWIRRRVHEPAAWLEAQTSPVTTSPAQALPTTTPTISLFRPPLLRATLVITAMNAASLFAWWGLFSWVPAFLSLPKSQGGHSLDILHTASFTILMQAGTFLGYTSFGVLADRFGRKPIYIAYLVVAALVAPLYALASSALAVLLLGPIIGFFGSGYFSGFSVIAAEAFPTALRGRAMGLAYNLGRVVSAAAPYTIGRLSETHGIAAALTLTSAGFLAAALIATGLRSTAPTPRPVSATAATAP
jgi:MFS family permease